MLWISRITLRGMWKKRSYTKALNEKYYNYGVGWNDFKKGEQGLVK